MNYTKVIDISLPLNEETVIYPGNPSLTIETSESEATKSVLSTVTLSSHVGTHLDAPRHISLDRDGIDKISLETFVGDCRVIDMSSSDVSISLEDVKKVSPRSAERILFKTKNSERGLNKFYNDFIFLSGDAAQYLADAGITLVGIDSWSIKQRGSKDNTPHTALLEKNITILEGIDLSQVTEGKYFLVALPLPFTGIDGSPTRAVLLQ